MGLQELLRGGVLRLLLAAGRGALEVLQVLLSLSGVLDQSEVLLLQLRQQVKQLLRLCEVQLGLLLQGNGGQSYSPPQVQ